MSHHRWATSGDMLHGVSDNGRLKAIFFAIMYIFMNKHPLDPVNVV